jgi:hypothetical protein
MPQQQYHQSYSQPHNFGGGYHGGGGFHGGRH